MVRLSNVFAATARGLTMRAPMRIGASLDNIRTDVRHAVRSLRRSPGFAAVALLALAVGIGGNTAVFSVVDATRVQAIPYNDPERLVNLIGNVDRGPVDRLRQAIERRGASYPDFLDWRAQATRSFEDLAAVDSQMMTLSGIDEPERHRDRVRVGVLLLAAACHAGDWPDLSRRRGSGVEALVSHRPQRSLVEAPVWRRSAGARPIRDAERTSLTRSSV